VKQRVRRLERKLVGERVSIAQADGTICVFPDREFWTLIFADEVAAALGETPDSPVSRALEHATPEAAAKIMDMIRAAGGDFLIRATLEVFGNVTEGPPDLSETRESDEEYRRFSDS
jgi:hypothetical protein